MEGNKMENKWIYRKKYHIELSDVDFEMKLKLSKLFNYIQDISSEHVDALGIGISDLERKHGVSWILLRLRMDIGRIPVWNEEIYIETWHHESRKLDFERDYIVYDSAGNVIASAVSTWVIVDIAARRIQKTEVLGFDYPAELRERAIDCQLDKLKPFGVNEEVYKKPIGYSDIDFNGHINNSKYIDYAMDCFAIEKHREYCVKSLEINYINEALPGDSIILYRDISRIDELLLFLEGISESNGKTIFRAHVMVEKKKSSG